MKMKSPRFLSNWYLIGLAAFTFIFLSQLAVADPLCTNCSVNLVKWAMPRAEVLMGGWIFAIVNESWMARNYLASAYMKIPYVRRAMLKNAEAQGAETASRD